MITIYCPDIECDSCVHVIERVFKKLQGINSYEIKDDCVLVDLDESLIKIDQVVQAIKEKGYRAALEPLRRVRIRDRTREFFKDKAKYALEHKMLRGIMYTFLLLVFLDALLIYAMPDPAFAQYYAWWIFYLTLSVSAIGGAVWHFKAYRAQYTCMVGMMVGMTLGMQSGMMIGYVLGATNGFFVGALVGMVLACVIGAYCGKCCGIMGVMEGMMAGIMGGTMGSMISVMMFTDHILWFTPVYMAFNIAILAGLSYMVYEEVVEDKVIIIKPASFGRYVCLSVCALAVLLAVMLLAPASIFMGGII